MAQNLQQELLFYILLGSSYFLFLRISKVLRISPGTPFLSWRLVCSWLYPMFLLGVIIHYPKRNYKEYDRPMIPKQKTAGTTAKTLPNPYSNFSESTVHRSLQVAGSAASELIEASEVVHHDHLADLLEERVGLSFLSWPYSIELSCFLLDYGHYDSIW